MTPARVYELPSADKAISISVFLAAVLFSAGLLWFAYYYDTGAAVRTVTPWCAGMLCLIAFLRLARDLRLRLMITQSEISIRPGLGGTRRMERSQIAEVIYVPDYSGNGMNCLRLVPFGGGVWSVFVPCDIAKDEALRDWFLKPEDLKIDARSRAWLERAN